MPVTHKTAANPGDVITSTIWNEDHSITSLIPDASDTYQIGDVSRRWDVMYVNQIYMLNPPVGAFNVYSSTVDISPRFRVTSSGTLEWSSGSTAADVNLYRASSDTLKTDDTFSCLSLKVGGYQVISSARDVTNIVSLRVGSSTTSGVYLGAGVCEIWRSGGDPFIDFKTSYATDYDARIQKLSDHSLKFEVGGAGNLKTVLTIGADGNVYIAGGQNLEWQINTGGSYDINLGFIHFTDTYPSGNRTLALKGVYESDDKYRFQWFYWDGSQWNLLVSGPDQTGYVEFKGDVTLKSASPVLKLENTSSSTAYPRLEFANNRVTYSLGLLYIDDPTLVLKDTTHGIVRHLMNYATGTGTTQFSWYNSNGANIMYNTKEGNLYIDGTYNTFSPELPKDWQESDYANYLQSQLNKPHPPRDEKGRKICICGKPGVCPEHKKEFEERYGFDTSTVTAATAKLVLHLMNKISQLEDKIAQLEEKLDQIGG